VGRLANHAPCPLDVMTSLIASGAFSEHHRRPVHTQMHDTGGHFILLLRHAAMSPTINSNLETTQ
jgi:hypothetical protein